MELFEVRNSYIFCWSDRDIQEPSHLRPFLYHCGQWTVLCLYRFKRRFLQDRSHSCWTASTLAEPLSSQVYKNAFQYFVWVVLFAMLPLWAVLQWEFHVSSKYRFDLNLLAPELFFFNFRTRVYKMWIMQESNTLELWNKLHFEEKKEGEYMPCLKYSVPIFVE